MKLYFVTYKVLILLIIAGLLINRADAQGIVKNGETNILKFNLNKENISLNGNWEFYDNQLYTPNDFFEKKVKNPKYLIVPGLWDKVLSRGARGYGTYRLKVSGLQKNELYAFNIVRIQSSYKLWINGRLYHSNGVVGKNKETASPKWSSDDIIFKPDKEDIELVLQVSNFHHKKGGIENPLLLGKIENIIDYSWSISALSIFLLGVLLIMASYHLAMFIFRSNDKSNLFFALTLIFSAVFSLSDGEILITKMIPDFNWEILLKIIHSSNYLRVLFFTLFIYVSFKEYLNKYIITVVTIIVALILLLILVTPAVVYSHALIAFFIITSFVLVYLIIGQIKALIDKKAGALFSFLGIFALILTVVNDVLKEYQIIQTVSLSTFGIFLFIIFHSYLISIQNSRAFRLIKNLTDSLLVQGKIKDALFSAKSYNLRDPLKAISKAVDADRALIFILDNNEWVTTNEYTKADNRVKSLIVKIFSEKENVYFSAISVKKAISSKKPVFTVVTDSLTNKDIEYFKGRNVNSVFIYPFQKQDSVSALIYLENFEPKPNFVKTSSEIIQAILPQVLIFMENFTSYNKLNKFNEDLEKKVLKTIDEIQYRNKELKVLRSETEQQNTQAIEVKENLEKQNQEINDGIRYAGKIQHAFLPKESKIKEVFADMYTFHKPKKKLSGDFFWFNKISQTESIFVLADSTGHGVSGALMSIIGHELLNDAVLYQNNKSPKIILNTIQKEFTERIAKDHDIGGMDLAVIYYDSLKKEIVYAGAQNSIYLIHDNNLLEYRATPISIGSSIYLSSKPGSRYFANRRFTVEKGDSLYMFTDGFVDQVGFKTGRKFMKNRFKDLLLSIHKETGDIQKEILGKTLEEWKSKENQTDDILIAGIRF